MSSYSIHNQVFQKKKGNKVISLLSILSILEQVLVRPVYRNAAQVHYQKVHVNKIADA
jgi:hypothetical protein